MDGESWLGEPASGGSATALLKVVHAEITSATVAAGGTLRVTTEHAVVEIHALADYESWNFNAPGNVLVVCTPGGGLACFPGHRDQTLGS